MDCLPNEGDICLVSTTAILTYPVSTPSGSQLLFRISPAGKMPTSVNKFMIKSVRSWRFQKMWGELTDCLVRNVHDPWPALGHET